MDNLDKETQLIAVKKVLEEMKYAEEYVKVWNASWLEQLLDAHCLPLHYYIGERDVREMERKYGSRYRLANAFYSADSIGIPLTKETIVGNNILTREKDVQFEVEFGRIDWFNMKSHSSSRHFSFRNNGIIEFSKDSNVKLTPKHPRKISYDTSFDVLSNDFNVLIFITQLTDDWKEKYKIDHLTLSLNGITLVEKYNDIEITKDLSTGMQLIKIIKEYDRRNKENNASVTFEVSLNPDNSLNYGSAEIQTHKGNGKVNGTYRFDVSRKKGIRANFYSRKGVKVDLASNPKFLGIANKLLPASKSNNSDNIIITNFANSTQEAIAKNLTNKVISFDNSDFNIEAVNQVEDKVIEMVKCIKGELPLAGLIDRIDNCLEFIDKNQIKYTPIRILK